MGERNRVRIDVALLVSKIKIAKERLVVYAWGFILTFVVVNQCFGFGHHFNFSESTAQFKIWTSSEMI